MSTRRRQKIAKGIYRDRFGVAIVVSVKGTPREFRKDEQGRHYSRLSKDALIVERKRIDAREHLKHEGEIDKGETLTADASAYLKTLSGRSRDDAENLLGHWLTAFRDRTRHSLTSLELRQHAATWRCAASTFNHRRQALISLYVALDGKGGSNPARDIPKRQETLGAPKALPYTVIAKVLAAMPPTQSRARLKVMAYIGLPQMQIEKLTPEDWTGPQLRVTPRRKGAGASGRWIPLSPEGQKAMAELRDRKAWGAFSRSSLWKAWGEYGPPGSNPYSLRHSWITELYRRAKGNVIAVRRLSLHSQLKQVERYADAAIEDSATALVVPRNRATTTTRNQSKSFQIVPEYTVVRRPRKDVRQRKKLQKTARK